MTRGKTSLLLVVVAMLIGCGRRGEGESTLLTLGASHGAAGSGGGAGTHAAGVSVSAGGSTGSCLPPAGQTLDLPPEPVASGQLGQALGCLSGPLAARVTASGAYRILLLESAGDVDALASAMQTRCPQANAQTITQSLASVDFTTRQIALIAFPVSARGSVGWAVKTTVDIVLGIQGVGGGAASLETHAILLPKGDLPVRIEDCIQYCLLCP
jgi:hypothetical protein